MRFSPFFTNASLMSLGNIFSLLIGLASVAIYVKVLGVFVYASIGTVLALFNVVERFDITYRFALLEEKRNMARKRTPHHQNLSTLYGSVVISNIALAILLVLLAAVLAFGIYKNHSLFPLYIIGGLAFLISRINDFLFEFLRVNGRELVVQKASTAGALAGLATGATLLLLVKAGALSFFAGMLTSSLLIYVMLLKDSSRIARFRLQFDSARFLRLLKNSIRHDYISKMISPRSIWGVGLLVSSFYLEPFSMGILALITMICREVLRYFYILIVHLPPLYSSALARKGKEMTGKMANSISLVLLTLTCFAVILSIIFAETFFGLFPGIGAAGAIPLLVLGMASCLLIVSFTAFQMYVFTLDFKIQNKINTMLFAAFIGFLFPLLGAFGLPGVIWLYFAYALIRALLLWLTLKKLHPGLLGMDVAVLSVVAFASVAVAMLTYKGAITPLFSTVCVFFLGVILISRKGAIITAARKTILESETFK